MNVMQGDKFSNRQRGKRNRTNVNSRFGNRNFMGNVTSAANKPFKTPKYSFDGIIENAETTNKRMGPPPAPSWPSRKRPSTSSTSGHRTTNSGSSENTIQGPCNSTSVLDISSNNKNVMWTPKYRNNSSGNPSSRGLISGSRSRTTPCSTPSNITVHDSCILIAVCEGRGAARGEVGIAAVDLKRPRLTLCQLSDRHSYLHTLTTIHFFHPVEIIVPNTFCDSIPTELYRVIRTQFPEMPVSAVQRRHFSDGAGLQMIQHLCAPEYSSVQLQLIHKFYALTAAAALLRYVEYIQCIVFQPHSLKIEYHASENSTFIDVETAIRLELVESLSRSMDRGGSLLSILNHTYTSGGLRSLRANILQPPCDETSITTRLSCVRELIEDTEGLMPTLQSVMKQLYDVDKILWLCMELPIQDGSKMGEAQLNHTLQLKTTMALVPTLIAALEMAKGQWFHTVRQDLENPKFVEISERIKRVIQDNVYIGRGAAAHHQRCFAVHPEINGLLDVARRSYSELVSDMEERVQQLSETYSLPLRVQVNPTRGFHIVMTVGNKNKRTFNVKDLPPVFFQIQNHGVTISMTTEEIVLMDQQAKESLTEIQTMSNIVIFGLLKELRPYMGCLYKLCEHVAELDVILSLAQVSTAGNYVRPLFNKYLELKNSIHPMLDYVIPTSSIPNDVFSSPEYNFHIVTGPNMGGKTIYIKQIALLQIMAQIGCFVPASKAVFRIADRIFSRIGFNDSIECNASSYVLEMKEIHYILQTITSTSLIIVDELCRGTSCEEGTSMAWAICERLLNTGAFVFFTTHFLYLTKLQDLHFNVVNLHTKAEEIDNDGGKKLVYKHKVVAGVTAIEHYGLTLAKNTNLPKTVISLAEELAVIIAQQKKPLPESEMSNKGDVAIYKLAADLHQECRKPQSNDTHLDSIIKNFKEMYPLLVETIHSEQIQQHLEENTTSESRRDTSSSQIKSSSPMASAPKGNVFKSQEDPLGSLEEMLPPPRRNLAGSSSMVTPTNAAQLEDVQASVTVCRKNKNIPALAKSNKNDSSCTIQESSSKIIDKSLSTTPVIKAINKPNVIVSDSDVISDYNKTSFIYDSSDYSDNRFTRKYVPYETQTSHFDVNLPSTSKGTMHSSIKRQQIGSQSTAKHFKSVDEDNIADDDLQMYLTNKMCEIFDGIDQSDENPTEQNHEITDTEELKEILKSSQIMLPSQVSNKNNSVECLMFSPDVSERGQNDFSDNEDMSHVSGNVWNPFKSKSYASNVSATGHDDISDLDNFINEVAMSENSSIY